MQAETTVIHQCTQLLSPSADPSYVMTYISHSFPQHRQYLCAGALILMHGHAENINSGNLVLIYKLLSKCFPFYHYHFKFTIKQIHLCHTETFLCISMPLNVLSCIALSFLLSKALLSKFLTSFPYLSRDVSCGNSLLKR